MKKINDVEAVKSIKGQLEELVNDLKEMLPSSFWNADSNVWYKPGKTIYGKKFGDVLNYMSVLELEGIRNCFERLLEPKTLRKLKREDKQTYDLLMAHLADKGYKKEDQKTNVITIDFESMSINIEMGDVDWIDDSRHIDISKNGKLDHYVLEY